MGAWPSGSAVGSAKIRARPRVRSGRDGTVKVAPSRAAGKRATIEPSSAESGTVRGWVTRAVGGIRRGGRVGVEGQGPAPADEAGLAPGVGDRDLGVGAGQDRPGRRVEAGRNHLLAANHRHGEDRQMPGAGCGIVDSGDRRQGDGEVAEAAVLVVEDPEGDGVGIIGPDGRATRAGDDARLDPLRAPAPAEVDPAGVAAPPGPDGAEVGRVGDARVPRRVADRRLARQESPPGCRSRGRPPGEPGPRRGRRRWPRPNRRPSRPASRRGRGRPARSRAGGSSARSGPRRAAAPARRSPPDRRGSGSSVGPGPPRRADEGRSVTRAPATTARRCPPGCARVAIDGEHGVMVRPVVVEAAVGQAVG